MASHDDPHRAFNAAPPPVPYNGAHFGTPSHSTPAPSYHSGHETSNPPYPQPPYGAPQGQPPRPGPSPFDSVFDDPAYPPDQRSYAAASNQGLYQDTGYYGQDHASKNNDSVDHIYDASSAENGTRRAKNKGKIRLGELGMFGANRKRIPFVVYTLTAIQVAVFIAEIVKNGILTGSPIMTKPQFNPMIGPSTQVMINMGARYVPCMHNVKEIQGSNVPVLFLCPNATTNDNFCSLSELCGFGGVPNPTFNNADQRPAPNQWFRFITPIFMHAGLIHIGFNLLMQLTIAKEMEVAIGPIRFFLVYMSAGIFGFVLGGNFAAPALPSTGASGSLFGIIALTLLDLFYSWKERKSPVKDLMFLILDMVISFALGLLPGLDNFAHIGGFVMGLALGICVLHSPNSLRKRMGNGTPYSVVVPGDGSPSAQFFRGPLGFFKGRKPFWWFWWIVRAVVLIVVIVVFIVLVNNFYTARDRCEWCKYLSCIPVSNWCEIGTIREDS
ncbi:rhomboid family protein [Hirsutella rhossiliensis]|uniref:Rhomboid-type serine protease n=1 Tax=Hirsutella rhossiliensis TaxID=111463 RepID=A0A9P8N5J0_9HYPO|nr:rhomboid family domain-containing protein [Hirsutella rhossiliensis]KAH0965037.1 rhomboid family domain-containing protein [Hirsutella rhossiliensis]